MKNHIGILILILNLSMISVTLSASDPDAPQFTAKLFETAPVIDGNMDEIWEALPWYSLNYVWMDWEASVDTSDYNGRFKIAWSETNNRLYFYVEITDDVLVEKYSELGGNLFYNDIVEVFIDENNSGGEHIFDTGQQMQKMLSLTIFVLSRSQMMKHR
jgi:hypothetical protein